MTEDRHLTAVNWPYVAFVVVASAVALGFIGWSVTAPAVSGRDVPGWSWRSIAAVDATLLVVFGALVWKVYKDSKTSIGATGARQPSLRGAIDLPWSQVRRVSQYGFGLHLHGERSRIVITPWAYRDSEAVVSAVLRYVAEAAP